MQVFCCCCLCFKLIMQILLWMFNILRFVARLVFSSWKFGWILCQTVGRRTWTSRCSQWSSVATVTWHLYQECSKSWRQRWTFWLILFCMSSRQSDAKSWNILWAELSSAFWIIAPNDIHWTLRGNCITYIHTEIGLLYALCLKKQILCTFLFISVPTGLDVLYLGYYRLCP